MSDFGKTPEGENYRNTFGWFGVPWPSGVCYDDDGLLREDMCKEAPVGEDCCLCLEPIEPGQSGKAIPRLGDFKGNLDADVVIEHVHKECLLRSAVGSPDHLAGRCTCCSKEPMVSQLTYREEALTVWSVLVGES